MEADLLGAFEEQSPGEIERVLGAGASPVNLIGGKRPIDCLIEGYLRSPRFADCLRVMIAAGAEVGDGLLQAFLLDNAVALREQIAESSSVLTRRLSLLTAFTCCRNVTALHVCAEFNSAACGKVLIEAGADVNARSAAGSDGVGGQTPIFHAVNSIFNLLPADDGDAGIGRSLVRCSGADGAVGRNDAVGDDCVRRDACVIRPVWDVSTVSSGGTGGIRQHCVSGACAGWVGASGKECSESVFVEVSGGTGQEACPTKVKGPEL